MINLVKLAHLIYEKLLSYGIDEETALDLTEEIIDIIEGEME